MTASGKEQYGYLSGRVRAMELQLLDSSRYNRLYEARSIEDVMRVLSESGYSQGGEPEDVLARELELVYRLMHEQMPENEYIDTLLLLHDFHNIKVILKYLSPWWNQPEASDEPELIESDHPASDWGSPNPLETLPEGGSELQQNLTSSLTGLAHLFLQPSLIDPPVLFQALTAREADLIPDWAWQTAVKAAGRYMKSYDISDIDFVVDQQAWQQVSERVSRLNNRFFTDYMCLRVDLINAGLLMRTRQLRSDERLLRIALLPGGRIEHSAWLDLYEEPVDAISQFLEHHDWPTLAAAALRYDERGGAAGFSLCADNLLIHTIRSARWSLSGPDIPLAYLIAREHEIKNVRIVVACLRNGISLSQARDLARDRYLDWR